MAVTSDQWEDRACPAEVIGRWTAEMEAILRALESSKTYRFLHPTLERSVELVIKAAHERSRSAVTIGTRELAHRLRVSERTVQSWAREGVLPARKSEHGWEFDLWDILDFIYSPRRARKAA
jgi:DNA-binding transcriptional regulator YiaG